MSNANPPGAFEQGLVGSSAPFFLLVTVFILAFAIPQSRHAILNALKAAKGFFVPPTPNSPENKSSEKIENTNVKSSSARASDEDDYEFNYEVFQKKPFDVD